MINQGHTLAFGCPVTGAVRWACALGRRWTEFDIRTVLKILLHPFLKRKDES